MEKLTALVIGRFQPFHNGHVKLIEHAADEAAHVVIGIGSSQESHTWQNPFSASERRKMIESSLGAFKRFEVVDVPDINDDSRWVDHVRKLCPKFDLVYSNGEREKKLFSDAGFDVRSTPMFSRHRYSGTEIRRRIAMGEPWTDFVPRGTIEVIRRVDGVRRIKDLSSLD